MTRLAIGDVHLNVERAGNGEPLVLLHGFTGSAAQWAPHMETLARRFDVTAVDLLGHGRSDIPASPARYGLHHAVTDVVTVLDRVGIERAHWLGYSMGGRVALAAALDHPERVLRLILEGASPGLADESERRARRARDEALAGSIERDGIDAFVDDWMNQPLFASQARLGDAALAAARAARCRNDPAGLSNSLRGLGTGAQPSLWHRLHELAPPTLLLVGEEDAKFRGIAESMAAQMPRAAITVIPAAGHTTHLENPAAFDAAVMAFLQRGPVTLDSPLLPIDKKATRLCS